jgi:DNA-directed RNA polymerase subunit alpha
MPTASHNTQLTMEGLMAATRIPIPTWARTEKADDRLDLSLAEIDLTVRTVNCLEEEKIFTVLDLLQCTRERLLQITNLGEKTVETIYAALEKIGFYRTSNPRAEEENEPEAHGFAWLSE